MRVLGRARFTALQDKALKGGAMGPSSHLRWSLGGWCNEPTVLAFGQTRRVVDGLIELEVPCRRCTGCLKLRAETWRRRGTYECQQIKTWFWTGTYGRGYRKVRGLKRTASGQHADAAELVKRGNPDLTNWLKLVRKHEGPIRYMAAPELQKDGTLHWHVLVHANLTRRQICAHWAFGYQKAKLVTDPVKGAGYVTKYVAKQRLGRVRASRGYGRPQGIGSGGERVTPTPSQQVEPLFVWEDPNTIVLNDPGKVLSEEGASQWVLSVLALLTDPPCWEASPDAHDLWAGRIRQRPRPRRTIDKGA